VLGTCAQFIFFDHKFCLKNFAGHAKVYLFFEFNCMLPQFTNPLFKIEENLGKIFFYSFTNPIIYKNLLKWHDLRILLLYLTI
jgi:hypothetical protein